MCAQWIKLGESSYQYKSVASQEFPHFSTVCSWMNSALFKSWRITRLCVPANSPPAAPITQGAPCMEWIATFRKTHEQHWAALVSRLTTCRIVNTNRYSTSYIHICVYIYKMIFIYMYIYRYIHTRTHTHIYHTYINIIYIYTHMYVIYIYIYISIISYTFF